MKVAVVAIALNEERFIKPWISHIPDWVTEVCVLVSSKPWFGDEVERDNTAQVARAAGAQRVVEWDWPSEEVQRNYAQGIYHDYDWLIILDPDEFLDNKNWRKLKEIIDDPDSRDLIRAGIVRSQYTYWKRGYLAYPRRDYQQLILVQPSVRFVDKRVVNTGFVVLSVDVHHFSWARTDREVLDKITHYGHANDFDTKRWYEQVWLPWKPGDQDVHPTSPETLHDLIPAKLPKELEDLNLWP
jgi:hypothetical protein